MKSTNLNSDSLQLLDFVFGGDLSDVWVCNEGAWTGFRVADGGTLLGDRGVYFCPSRMKPGMPRALANVERVHALVVDDVGTKVPMDELLVAGVPQPSYVLETSPGNYQFGYVFEGGVPGGVYAAIRAGLKWKADGKAAIQWFRLPQGVNTGIKSGGRRAPGKWPWALGAPTIAEPRGAMDIGLGLSGGEDTAIAKSGTAIASDHPELQDIERLAEVVGMVPNDASTSRDEWVEVGHAICGASGKSEDGFAVFRAWSSKWPGGGSEEEDRRLWDGIVLDQVRSKGGLLRARAEAADPEGFRAWDAARAFDDGLEAPADASGTTRETPQAIDPVQLHVAGEIERAQGWRIRFNHDRGCWHTFGVVWAPLPVSMKEGFRLAKHWAETEAPALRLANKTAFKSITKAGFYNGVEDILRQTLPCRQNDFDQQTMMTGTPGGTIMMDRTGAVLRPADHRDMISRSTAVIPSETEDCPLWLKFLSETVPLDVFGNPDRATLVFLRQWAAYCLTGSTKEHVFLFIWGPGGNGKSVFVDTLAWVLGDYAVKPVSDIYFTKSQQRHMQEIAMLAGARLITLSEVPPGARWDEHKLKDHTGGGSVTANFMRENSFTFTPEFKIVVYGNHMPTFPGGINPAIRRRFKMLKFDRVPDVVDKDLPEKLKAEGPGILRWAINGLTGPQGWLTTGLIFPDTMETATEAYIADQDHLAQWIADRVEKKRNMSVPSSELFHDWIEWRNAAGHDPVFNTQTAFGVEMQNRGFKTQKTKAHNVFADIVLKSKANSAFSG